MVSCSGGTGSLGSLDPEATLTGAVGGAAVCDAFPGTMAGWLPLARGVSEVGAGWLDIFALAWGLLHRPCYFYITPAMARQ